VDETIYWRCRKAGGAFWLDGRSWLRFSGGDVVRFLNGQCTNDVRRWDGSRSLCAAVVSSKGRLLAEVFLARGGDGGIILDGPAGLGGALVGRFGQYVVADDVSILGCGQDFRAIHAWGEAIAALRDGRGCSPNNRIGLEGADIFWEGGGDPDVGAWLCPDEVAEVLRVEAGVPAWGRELDGDTLLPEADSGGRWISYTKGCYIGQEVISRIKSVGHVNRKLVGFTLAGDPVSASGANVMAGGKISGRVTSVVRSPSLQKTIALGFVQRHDSKVGTEVAIGGSPGVVVALPFVS
jgi:folate-binding protein YgfZ